MAPITQNNSAVPARCVGERVRRTRKVQTGGNRTKRPMESETAPEQP